MSLLSDIFTWWNGATLGTKLFTRRHGRLVGQDEWGNKYYEQREVKGPLGRPRRWVIYNGLAEASKVPPEWHAWLHYTVDTPPTEEAYRAKPWEKPHIPNMTGTPQAYRPPGSILRPHPRPQGEPDYEPWQAE